MRLWSRTSYLAATAAVTAAGGAAAAALDWAPGGALAAGLAVAWLLQAPSFWRLAGALERGEPVVREWVGGIALRLGGLAVLAAAGAATELPGLEAAVAYVAALLVYLGLEAVWLFRRQPGAGAVDGRSGEARDVSANESSERTPEAGSHSHRSR